LFKLGAGSDWWLGDNANVAAVDVLVAEQMLMESPMGV
jgi:hypothetical protein